MAKMSLEELRRIRGEKQQELQKRDNDGKSIQIIVGMGTCGIAAGAKTTLDAFVQILDEKGIAGNVLIRQTGCMGLCANEPTVEVIVPGMPTVIYGNVDADTAKVIVEKHLMHKELLDKQILDRPSADIMKN